MMVKAVMIAGNFMHLRYEKRNLAIMVGLRHPGRPRSSSTASCAARACTCLEQTIR